MSPNDPRHGTRRGYYAHRKDGETACDACKRGAASAEQRYVLDRMRGRAARVPILGTKRRLRALQAVGWTLQDIANVLGVPRNRVEKWCADVRRGQPKIYVYASTATLVAKVYDELCMVEPSGRWATRIRNQARRNGWPPPLAWDDIDDPAESPTNWQYQPATRHETFAELVDRGAGVSEVCRVLKLSRDSLQKWCARGGLSDDFRTVVGREHTYGANQFTEEAS